MFENELETAIAHIKLGDKNRAFYILSYITTNDPQNENAWLWLATCVDSHEEKLDCLGKVLQINPNNQKAKEYFYKLGGKNQNIDPSYSQLLVLPSRTAVNNQSDNQIQTTSILDRNYFWIIAISIVLFIGFLFFLLFSMLSRQSAASSANQVAPAALPGSIKGTVSWETLGAGNVLVVGIPINVWDSEGNQIIATAITNSNGDYEILGIKPGFYKVSAYQHASVVGDQIASKCWVLDNILVEAGEVTQLFLSINTALLEEEYVNHSRQCQ